jgi:hypothetical protein
MLRTKAQCVPHDGVPKPLDIDLDGAELVVGDRPDCSVLETWEIERRTNERTNERTDGRRQLKRNGVELTVVV